MDRARGASCDRSEVPHGEPAIAPPGSLGRNERQHRLL